METASKSKSELELELIWRRPGHSFPTIYTDIMMINNAQTCHMLVSCVFDWSALGARLVMIAKSADLIGTA